MTSLAQLGPAAQRQAVAQIGQQAEAKQSKYRNQRCALDGFKFASKREMMRYACLVEMQRVGMISGLLLQKRFALVVNGVHIADYIADFDYTENTGALVVEDAKGFRTPAYRIKRRLMLACHGITIRET